MLKVYSDGGVRGNPGPAAIAFIIFDDSNHMVKEYSEYLNDEETNNRAEYLALLRAVEAINAELNDRDAIFYSDSQLLINQLSGLWKSKDNRLRHLRQRIIELLKDFDKLRFEWVGRDNIYIQHVDSLVNKEFDKRKKTRRVNLYNKSILREPEG